MKEGTSVEQHLKLMKDLTDQLAVTEAPIAEEDKVIMLLGSLPRSYSNVVTAFEVQKDLVQLYFLQQALLHAEQKRSPHVQVASRSYNSSGTGLCHRVRFYSNEANQNAGSQFSHT